MQFSYTAQMLVSEGVLLRLPLPFQQPLLPSSILLHNLKE